MNEQQFLKWGSVVLGLLWLASPLFIFLFGLGVLEDGEEGMGALIIFGAMYWAIKVWGGAK